MKEGRGIGMTLEEVYWGREGGVGRTGGTPENVLAPFKFFRYHARKSRGKNICLMMITAIKLHSLCILHLDLLPHPLNLKFHTFPDQA